MIELSANIDIYDNGTSFTSATNINAIDYTNTAYSAIYKEIDVSGIINGNFTRSSKGTMPAENMLYGMTSGIISYDTDETVTCLTGGYPVISDIINIKSTRGFSSIFLTFPKAFYARKAQILSEETYTQTFSLQLLRTGRQINFPSIGTQYEYIIKIPNSLALNYRVVDFSIPIEFAQIKSSWFLQLRNSAYLIVYANSGNLSGASINIEVTYRVIEQSIDLLEYSNVISLDNFTNNLFIMFEDYHIPTYIYKSSSIPSIFYKKGIEINLMNAKQLGIERSDREDYKLPQYGLISSGSSLEFFDTENQVELYYEMGLLIKGIPFYEYINNTLTKRKEKIASYVTTQWEYSNLKRICRVSYDDGLTKLQDIQVPSINYDARYPQSQSAHWFLRYMADYIPFNIIYNNETTEVLESTIIPYPYLESGNAWDSLNKICTLCQLHGYVDKNGELVLKYNGGN